MHGGALAPCKPCVRELQGKTCLTCSWLHLLSGWSLHQSRGDSVIRFAVNFGRETLKLKYGFSLHALPKAIEFYERIGMVRHAPLDKDGLPYFEMPNKLAREFAEA